MEIEVNGITFSQNDLTTISITKLKIDSVSPAHLFLPAGRRFFLVLRAGDYIDQEFLEKYQDRGVESFFALEIANQECIKKYNDLWSSLASKKLEHQRIEFKEQLFLNLCQDYWKEGASQDFLSFVISCNQTFSNIETIVINEIQSTSHILYSRALLSSAHGLIGAMANGLHEFNFLQDIYNLCFLLDYGLVTNNFTYALLQACEFERNNPASNKETLKKILNDPGDRDFFFDHPHVSAELAQSFEDKFNYPELIESIRLHHEKVDGSGFPDGIHYSAISSWDAILHYADFSSPFEETIFKRADGNKILKESLLKIINDKRYELLPVLKISQNILRHFEWAEKDNLEEAS